MSIYKKDFKEIKKQFRPDEIINAIVEDKYLLREANLIVSRELSIDFKSLLDSAIDIFEKCEAVMLLWTISLSEEKTSYNGWEPMYENLNGFFKRTDVRTIFNLMYGFIEASGFKIETTFCEFEKHNIRGHNYSEYSNKDIKRIERWMLVPTEISILLDEISDPEINELVLSFRRAQTLKEKEKFLFAIQKPFYSQIRKMEKAQKGSEFKTVNLNVLMRKNECIVRHGEEYNDMSMKKYFEQLSESEKLIEIEMLMFDWLNVICKLKLIK